MPINELPPILPGTTSPSTSAPAEAHRAVPTAVPTSLAAAATAARPTDAFADRAPTPAGASPINAAMIAMARAPANGPSEFELIEGIERLYPDTIGLPGVLEELGKTPEGRETIGRMFDVLATKTGVVAPPELVAEAKRNPRKMMQALQMSPSDMARAIGSVDKSFKEGKIKNPEHAPDLLPHSFDFDSYPMVVSPARVPVLEDIGSGLFTGTIPSETSDEQVKRNRVMAEVFQRLTSNTSLSDPSKTFEVIYKGLPISRVSDFVDALTADGYTIETTFESRVAYFTELHQLVPGSNPPKYLDVPAPLMVMTGHRDPSNQMAMVPASHSEMNIAIKGGPDSRLRSDIRFYQGMSGTGFFPANINADPAWLGRVVHGAGTYTGAQAIKAVKASAVFTDLIHSVGKELNLYAEGYGQTGVCDDSIAIIHQVVDGKGHEYYPLLMQDSLLTAGIAKKLADADTSNDALLGEIREAMRILPSDTQADPTAPARALAALPWRSERDPFGLLGFARRLLKSRIPTH